ncbi:ABC transporter permease [Streptosporangiaceae bacterium NEAU-GS5]|nr:ABC transporter permease [Streptosporangiaceae bacterium NEAU-GS5]
MITRAKVRQGARVIVIGGAISYRALFTWTAPAMFVSSLFVVPVLQLLFFTHLGRQLGVADDRFFVIGGAVLSAGFPCVFGGTMAVANERAYGTLGAVLLTPGGRVALWAGRMVPYVLNGLIVAVFTLVTGVLILRVRIAPADLLMIVPTLVTAAASCSALGLALGAIGLMARDVFMVSNLAMTVLLLVSGADVPRSALPGWMRAVGEVTPVTHAVVAARAVAGGAPLADALPALAGEAAIAVVLATAAVVLLRWFEHGSRRRGALDAH